MVTTSSPRHRIVLPRTARLIGFAAILGITLPGSLSAQIVRGQVVDSITGAPIDGSVVLLIDGTGAEITRTITDSEGLFLLRAPSAGRFRLRAEGEGYRASLFPPFDLAADQMLAYKLLVPALEAASAPPELETEEEIITRVCADGPIPGQPVIVGLVRNAATQESVPDANVILSWSALPGMLRERLTGFGDAQGVAVTGSTGFYAVCGAPAGTGIAMHAEHQGMTSELLRVRFEDGGVYIGEAFTPIEGRIWRQDLDLLPLALRTASITGTVTDTIGRRLAGAQVHVVGTTFTARANLFGEFRLERLPPGHFRLAVEAVGYRPAYGDVELASGEAVELPPSFLAMTPAPPELEPITVRAERPRFRRDLSEFEERRASTTGSFITREEFEKQGNVRRTTDILRRMRGIRVNPGFGALEWIITTSRGAGRGGMDPGRICFPLIFLDRQYLGDAGSINLDQQIPVENIEAVEAYTSSAGMPPIYNRRGSVCGVIAFWTR